MAFDPQAYTTFHYRDAIFLADKYLATFHYSLTGDGVDEVSFTETLQFTPALPDRPDDKRFGGLLVLLGAVLGLSYYKAAAPGRIELHVPGLTEQAVDYLRTLVREGLSEFAYRNELPGPLTPDIVSTSPLATPWPIANWRELSGDPLVPIGGGKDSVVTVELLQRHRLHPIQFAVNPNPIIHRVARSSGHALLSATRTIDPKLLQLNAEGALNGHVPVTAMNSLVALAQSRLLDIGPVVMSNEHSASEPTLSDDGWIVNHQWSKSVDAEVALQEVIGPQAGLSPEHYFSLLRPFSELRIAGVFATYPRYHRVATSCNRAFRLDAGDVSWCGECDKCRFVFLVLSTYLAPGTLRDIFGRDMLNEPDQIPGFEALLGIHSHKPFECVGTEAESMVALSHTARRKDWQDHQVVAHFRHTITGLTDAHPDLEDDVLNPHDAPTAIPERYLVAQNDLR